MLNSISPSDKHQKIPFHQKLRAQNKALMYSYIYICNYDKLKYTSILKIIIKKINLTHTSLKLKSALNTNRLRPAPNLEDKINL